MILGKQAGDVCWSGRGHAIIVLQVCRKSVVHCSMVSALPRPLGLSHTLSTAVPMFKEMVGHRASIDLWLLVMS